MSAEEAGRLYAEARQMEKRVTVGRLELRQLCQQGLEDIGKMVELKIQHIRQLQQQAEEQLNATQKALLSSNEWERFQQYAQEIRKIHLGGKNVSILPTYRMQPIQTYLHSIDTAKQRCEAIVSEFAQQMKTQGHNINNTSERELSFNAVTAHSERILEKIRTEPSFDISPIKRKQNLLNNHLPEKDNVFQDKRETIPSQERLQVSPRQVVSKEIAESNLRNVNSLKQSHLNINPIFPATTHRDSDAREVTPISLRRPSPLHPTSPQQAPLQMAASSRRGTGQLSKVKSQGQIGGRGVLEMLQVQQRRFDKLRHGLQ